MRTATAASPAAATTSKFVQHIRRSMMKLQSSNALRVSMQGSCIETASCFEEKLTKQELGSLCYATDQHLERYMVQGIPVLPPVLWVSG